MKASLKLSSEERRAAIIKAVRRAFAEKGFHGTTTRELAEAAEVSEALLFKHFPNSEAALFRHDAVVLQGTERGKVARLATLEPSASTLVCLVHMLVSHMIAPRTVRDDEETLQNRLLFRSMSEDGEFARLFFRGMPADWSRKVGECLKAAAAAGDAAPGPVRPEVGAWFIHHLAGMIMIHLQPAKPITDYGVPPEKLVEEVVWFALRGLGLKEEVIKRYYNPKALICSRNDRSFARWCVVHTQWRCGTWFSTGSAAVRFSFDPGPSARGGVAIGFWLGLAYAGRAYSTARGRASLAGAISVVWLICP